MNAKLRALMLIAGCMVGGLSLMSCKEEESEQFGFTCIELQKGQGVDGDPFAGTVKIEATLAYEPCLIDYYLNKHPEMRADGPDDAGGAVFAEWKDRLCTEAIDRRIDCEVESFEQTINSGGVTKLYNMKIVYNVLKPDELVGRRLLCVGTGRIAAVGAVRRLPGGTRGCGGVAHVVRRSDGQGGGCPARVHTRRAQACSCGSTSGKASRGPVQR